MTLDPKDFGFRPVLESFRKSKGRIKYLLRRVQLNSGGYTSGGRYYGTGLPLYEADAKDFNGETITFRARSAVWARKGLESVLMTQRTRSPGVDNQTIWDIAASQIARDGIK